MITHGQHQALWENIRRLRWAGFDVETSHGERVVSCTMENDGCSINLVDQTRITHCSYSPGTTYRCARAKFRICSLPLSYLRINEIGMEYDRKSNTFKEIG